MIIIILLSQKDHIRTILVKIIQGHYEKISTALGPPT